MNGLRYSIYILIAIASTSIYSCSPRYLNRRTHKRSSVHSKHRNKHYNPAISQKGEIYGTLTMALGGSPINTTGFSSSITYPYIVSDLVTNQTYGATYTDSTTVGFRSGSSPNFVFGFEVGHKRRIFGEVNGGFIGGASGNYIVNLGLGYNLRIPDQKIITFRPSVAFGYQESTNTFDNTIDNTYKNFIAFGQVFPYKYTYSTRHGSHTAYAKKLDTEIRNYQGGMKLKMGFWLFPDSWIVTRCNVGYFIPFYEGTAVKAYSAAMSESLNYNDPSIQYRSSAPPNQTYHYDGFFWNIEVGVKF